MRFLKLFALCFILFTAGFLTHALLFPEFLANGLIVKPEILISNENPLKAVEIQSEHTVTFDGKKFSKNHIVVPVTRYLIIRNENEIARMSLSSNNQYLTTPRPYALGEQIRTRLDKKGDYLVKESATGEELLVTVK